GERVRYDAQIKSYPQLVTFVTRHFKIIGICPEVEIGLGVPRPAVQLSGEPDNIKITGRDDPTLDISHALLEYCKHRVAQLDSIHGYIFKSKSPSCGIRNIAVFNTEGDVIATTRGVFANAVYENCAKQNRALPIADETDLLTAEQCNEFLLRVQQFHQSCLKNP
ncbi:COG1683: Uncharacterized conserved protein / FIG143828: Hypothetical protein YbgA, partial [hydrothermal vent metagenome]